jgi:hypothetical protein
MSSNQPGFTRQQSARTAFRVAGVVLLFVALGFLANGLADFFSSADTLDGPHKFWMIFVGILLLGPAGWCLQAGFMGAASRYVAGETMPVVKDSASYLTDGQGFLGVGRTDSTPATPPTDGEGGPFCSHCGVRNDENARFCDGCGVALAR